MYKFIKKIMVLLVSFLSLSVVTTDLNDFLKMQEKRKLKEARNAATIEKVNAATFKFREQAYSSAQQQPTITNYLPNFSAQIMKMENAYGFPGLDMSRRYNEATWVVSHNAPFNPQADYVYYNQNGTLDDQFKFGSRGFEFDIERRCWSVPFKSDECGISLCHETCQINKLLQPRASGLFTTTGAPNGFRTYGLQALKRLLGNGIEIFTVTLENRVKNYKDLDAEFEKEGIQDFILKPSDWDIDKNDGWPTFDWMVKNNKRIVVFNDQSAENQGYTSIQHGLDSTKYTWYQWANVVQNQWGGAKDLNKALQERASSASQGDRARYLFEFDWFADGGKMGGGISDLISKVAGLFNKETPFTGDESRMNGPDLENAIKAVAERGLSTGLAKMRAPNFIKIDFVDKGYAVRIANAFNLLTNNKETRAALYRPLWPNQYEAMYQKAIAAGTPPTKAVADTLTEYKRTRGIH